jgi:hypothetical protein
LDRGKLAREAQDSELSGSPVRRVQRLVHPGELQAPSFQVQLGQTPPHSRAWGVDPPPFPPGPWERARLDFRSVSMQRSDTLGPLQIQVE